VLLVRLSLPHFIIPHTHIYIAALLHSYSINSVLHSSITTIREMSGPTFTKGTATRLFAIALVAHLSSSSLRAARGLRGVCQA
jgi:hypothetical protein